MAQTIQIRRTTGSGDPTLSFGELAYVDGTGGLWVGLNGGGQSVLNSLPNLTDVTVTSQDTGDIVYASSATAWANLGAGANNTVLKSNGVSAAPSYSAVDLTTMVTGTLPDDNGGTGFSTYTQGDLLYASATDTLAKMTVGGSNTYLRSDGTDPSWGALDISHDTTPTLGGNLAVSGNVLDFTTTDSCIRLDPELSASTDFNGITIEGVAGTGGLSSGDVVYYDGTTNDWLKTDADAEASAGDCLLGIVPDDISAAATGTIVLQGFIRSTGLGTGTSGNPAYLDTVTAGNVTSTRPSGTGDIVRVVGYWYDANTLYFCPSNTWVEV